MQELGYPTDGGSISQGAFIILTHSVAEMVWLSAEIGVDFQAMFISPAKVPAPHQKLATDSSDDDLPKPPPRKGSQKSTRAGNSQIAPEDKSVDQFERSELGDKSDDGKLLKLVLKDSGKYHSHRHESIKKSITRKP